VGRRGSALNTIVAKEFDLRGAFRFHEEFGIAVDLLNQGLVDEDLNCYHAKCVSIACAALVAAALPSFRPGRGRAPHSARRNISTSLVTKPRLAYRCLDAAV
jgi:hypothetical protein